MNGTNDELHTEPRGYVPEQKMGSDYSRPHPISAVQFAGHPNVCTVPNCGRSAGHSDLCDVCSLYRAIKTVPHGNLPTMPTDPTERKQTPIASGVLDYFPLALAAVAYCSWKGNEQHNPGQPLHWDRAKSTDDADALLRHFMQRGAIDTDGVRHSAKTAWRALALLQKELENAASK